MIESVHLAWNHKLALEHCMTAQIDISRDKVSPMRWQRCSRAVAKPCRRWAVATAMLLQ